MCAVIILQNKVPVLLVVGLALSGLFLSQASTVDSDVSDEGFGVSDEYLAQEQVREREGLTHIGRERTRA